MQKVSVSVVAATHQMVLDSAKGRIPKSSETIIRNLGCKLTEKGKHLEVKSTTHKCSVESAHPTCCNTTRSDQIETHDGMSRRSGTAAGNSHPSVQKSKPKRRLLDGNADWQKHQHQFLRLETESVECRKLLETMQADCEVFRQFASWTEVVTHMENGKIRRPETDAILVPIFKRMEWEVSPLWHSILLILFWKSLKAIYNHKRVWCPDDEDRWQNVLLAFLWSTKNVDLNRRKVRLAQKLVNDTECHYCKICRKFPMWSCLQDDDRKCHQNILMKTKNLESQLIEGRDEMENLIRIVLEHAEKKVISEWGAEVLIATRLKGKQLKDLPDDDCTYETAKKRRQREEARLARVLPIWRKLMPGTRHLGV